MNQEARLNNQFAASPPEYFNPEMNNRARYNGKSQFFPGGPNPPPMRSGYNYQFAPPFNPYEQEHR